MRTPFVRSLVAVACAALIPSFVLADEPLPVRYVSPTGDDGASGLDADHPWGGPPVRD